MGTTPTSIRLGPDDELLLQRLEVSTGIRTRSDLIRLALRELAKARGVETAVQQLASERELARKNLSGFDR
jgi:Arc/MetJ-type ribon-helix-helix transcriptional regulator